MPHLDGATAAVLLLNGLATASTLFIVASGLSLIFGVTRIVNFAHGSFYMLGAFVAYSLVTALPRSGFSFWGAVVLAALVIGALGALLEVTIPPRVGSGPRPVPAVATFGGGAGIPG